MNHESSGAGRERGRGQDAMDGLGLISVIDAMADPVIVIRPDYEVVLVNSRGPRTFS